MDPEREIRYRLEIDGNDEAGFAEVSLAELPVEPIDYREGDEITTVRKINGLSKYASITLKWGITDSTELADWWRTVLDGRAPEKNAPRPVVIRVLGERGEEAGAFEVLKAWPCKYVPSDLHADGNEIAIDTLELCNEGMKRIR